jgi:CheY-like chemotaxis protein
VSLRVLVADDDPDMRTLARARLTRAGWQVDTVADGASALDRWRSSDYDAIVLDQRMGSLSGLDTARRLRDVGYRGPLLIFSAYLEQDVESDAETLGITTVDKASIGDLERTLERTLTPEE